jgi:hypothetical protein
MNADEASAQCFPTTGDDLRLDEFSAGAFLGNELDVELLDSLVATTDQAWVDVIFQPDTAFPDEGFNFMYSSPPVDSYIQSFQESDLPSSYLHHGSFHVPLQHDFTNFTSPANLSQGVSVDLMSRRGFDLDPLVNRNDFHDSFAENNSIIAMRQQPTLPNLIDQGARNLALLYNPILLHHFPPSHDATTTGILQHESLDNAFTLDSSAFHNTLQPPNFHGISLGFEHGRSSTYGSEMNSNYIAGSHRMDALALTEAAEPEETVRRKKISKARKAKISEAEWEAKKDIIIELSKTKQYTMNQLRYAMKTIHDFDAS